MVMRDDLLERFGPMLIEALILVTKDEFNTIRSWIRDLKTEIAATTNLTDLQTRIAKLPSLPDRDNDDILTAIQNKLEITTKYNWMD